MESTVDNNNDLGSVLDDAELAPTEEQETDDLSSVISETEAKELPKEQPKEPGWIKGRINQEVAKAEKRIRDEYDAMLAPLRESVMEREAQELVQSGEFKTLDRAKEYVRLKNGVHTESGTQTDSASTREPHKNSAKTETQPDPVIRARADLLAKQAQKIKQNTGFDVMQEFNENPEIRQKVSSGEWDFHDVVEQLNSKPEQRKKIPAPMRSPNGARAETVSVADMSEDQFRRLQANLASGRKYDMRK